MTFIAADESVPFAVNLLDQVQRYLEVKGKDLFEVQIKTKNGYKEVWVKRGR